MIAPRPRAHPDLATLVALTTPHQDPATPRVENGLEHLQRLLDPQPPRHSPPIIAPNRSPRRSAGILRMTATLSSTVGGSAGYRTPLLRGGRPALWPGIAAGERLRPVASSNTEEEDIAPSLREQIVDRTALPPQHSRRSRRAATPQPRRDRRPQNRPRSP